MYIMGMSGFSYYFSWFVRYFAVYLTLFIIVSTVLSSVFTYMPFHVLLVVGLSFGLCLMGQLFFIQVFTTRAKIGILISVVIYAFQYIFSLIATYSDYPTLIVNALVSLSPHSAYILAFRTLLYCQSYKITASFTEEVNNYIIGYEVLTCLVNAAFFFILTWYLDQVIPNEWGAKRHPLFCFTEKSTALLTKEEKQVKKR